MYPSTWALLMLAALIVGFAATLIGNYRQQLSVKETIGYLLASFILPFGGLVVAILVIRRSTRRHPHSTTAPAAGAAAR